jgi:hypothetical protein
VFSVTVDVAVNVYNTLKDFDNSLLKCRSLLKPNFDLRFYLGTLIRIDSVFWGKYLINLILPTVGSVISSVATVTVVYRFLDGMLQNLKDDAVLIYGHINKTNADHRI